MERFEDRGGFSDTGDGPGESSKTHGATSRRVTGQIPVADVNPEWISLDTVHAWMNTCRDLHNCDEYSSFGHAPAWLIDVQDKCLVPSPSNTVRYCALSYVWGQVKSTKLTTANLDDFCKPGAFSADNPSIDISKTIRHAIELVRVLGERYIWVDALCIVQDDGAHFHAELRNMGAIYHKAYLTVVAATAWDANEGLRGLKGISPRRHLASNFADDLHKYLDPETMIWNSRGWTFQEGLFSRRMLMFCGQTAIWRCTTCTIDETGIHRPLSADGVSGGVMSLQGVSRIQGGGREFDRQPLDNNTALPEPKRRWGASKAWEKLTLKRRSASRGKPELSLKATTSAPLLDQGNLQAQLRGYFKEVVTPFNTRNFTYQSDLPRAFDGIAHFLTQNATPGGIFSKGFLWGLPLTEFPHALTWCTMAEDLRPRDDDALGFPSWSWFGWEGNVVADVMEPSRLYPGQAFLYAGSLNIVTFRRHVKRSVCQWTPIVNTGTGSGNVHEKRDARGIRLVAQRCQIKAQPDWREGKTYSRTYHYVVQGDRDMEHAVITADRPADVNRPVDAFLGAARSVHLLAISEFEALEGSPGGTIDETKKPTVFVKALWVEPIGTRSGVEDDSRYRRKGVAIVERGLWDRNLKAGEDEMVTVLE